MLGNMRMVLVPCVVVLAALLCRGAVAQYDSGGLQEMANHIWAGGPGDSLSSPLDALDAMLVLLNSRKLHRRQAPSTCPYCPSGYPCSQGCPTVPSVYPPTSGCGGSSCYTGGAGSPGPPGPPGSPGFPIYFPGVGGCPGAPGPPGLCVKGPMGQAGVSGRDGSCPSVSPVAPLNVDRGAVQQLILQHMNCNTVTRCRYTIDELLLRLHRLETRFNLMELLKQRLSVAEQTMARFREAYIAKRIAGPRGNPGHPGLPGLKGPPGYEGPHGICKEASNKPPVLPRGSPGVPGPKGEPGPQGNKICDCNGSVGDEGVHGLGLVGETGPRGWPGPKGSPGTSSHRTP